MFFKIYCKWHTMCLDIRLFFRFLYKKVKHIFSKEVITIYVSGKGDDKNSGFNIKKPKLTISSALNLIVDCPLTKKNPFKIVSLFEPKKKLMKIVMLSDSKGRESITVPNRKTRIKL